MTDIHSCKTNKYLTLSTALYEVVQMLMMMMMVVMIWFQKEPDIRDFYVQWFYNEFNSDDNNDDDDWWWWWQWTWQGDDENDTEFVTTEDWIFVANVHKIIIYKLMIGELNNDEQWSCCSWWQWWW